MCGIAGLLYPTAVTPPGAELISRRLQEMADAMRHRGPDGEGYWRSEDSRVGLAHRRLAIIDLSPEAAQPMSSGNGQIWITFNGEIYNHMKLRDELLAKGYKFKTHHSDTEVLIHGYHAWGVKGLANKIEGMFALAIWDKKRAVMTLLRDRVGVKPIYFSRFGGVFRFASEIKALLSDPNMPRQAEMSAVGHYLSFMVAPAPVTLFKHVFKLPAGHIMEITARGVITTRRYWDALPGKSLERDATDRDLANGILKRLESAIEKRMMSDVPIGVFLSGGIDSSTNVALMNRFSPKPVETFTIGFSDKPQFNEMNYARKIAEKFKTNHHEIVITGGDMQGYLSELIYQQDEPIADWVCVPLYFLSKLAKEKGVTVVQVGEGADEQFCGYDSWMSYLTAHRRFWDRYNRYTPMSLRRIIGNFAPVLASSKRDKFAKFAEALLRAGCGRELFWSGANSFWNIHKNRILDPVNVSGPWEQLASMGLDITGLSEDDSGAVVGGYLSKFDQNYPGQDFLTRMIYAEFRQRLPELLLMRVDKITMSTSIEGRVPFLDHNLVDYSMNIPQATKVKDGVKKAILKTAVKGIIPDEIINRPKMGFTAPIADWLREDFGAQVERDLLKSPLITDGPLNNSPIANLISEHRSGRANHALHIWTLFNLTAWHNHWIE